MASPCVAGAIGMVRSMNPTRVYGTACQEPVVPQATDLGDHGKDTNFGCGLLQMDPEFLRTLKNADAFFESGTHLLLWGTIECALLEHLPRPCGYPRCGILVLKPGLQTMQATATLRRQSQSVAHSEPFPIIQSQLVDKPRQIQIAT